MAPRLQVDSGLTPERVRPTASPVDTFVPSAQGQQLAQLAQGLREFAPSLERFTNVLSEKDIQKQTELGTQKARELEEQRVTYRDAVNKGLINASDNPWFLLGAKQQFGRAAAGQYARALQAAIETDPAMQSSTDPADFDKFEGDFRKKWLDENVGDNRDVHFEKGFGVVDGYVLDEGRQFVAAVGGRLEKRAGNALGVIVGQVLDNHYKEGPGVAAGLINAEIKSYLVDNPKAGRIANLRSVEAVADWARLNYKDVTQEQIADLLKQIDAGPGSKLYGTHEARQMLAEVGNQIVELRQRDLTVAHAQEAEQRNKAEDSVYTDLGTALGQAENPNTVDLKPFINRMRAINPSPNAAASVFQMQDVFVNQKSQGDPIAYGSALMRVYGLDRDRPGFLSLSQAAGMLLTRELSPAQYSAVVNEIQQRDTTAESHDPTKIGGAVFSQYKDLLLRKMRVTEFGTNDPTDVQRSGSALRDYLLQYGALKDKTPASLTKLVDDIALNHMSDEQLTTETEGKAQSGARKKERGEFQGIIEKMVPADSGSTLQLRSEIEALDKREIKDFSETMKQWLFGKGLPPDRDTIKRFLLEFQNQ